MATLYKRKYAKGISYTLQWHDETGRHRKALGFISREEAAIRLHDKELELRGVETQIMRDNLVFRNFINDYLEWYAEAYPASIERVEGIFEKHLLPVFGHLTIDKIRIPTVEKYVTKRKQTIIRNLKGPVKHPKKETINKELRQLKAALNTAVDWELIPYNPIARLKFLKVNDSKPLDFFSGDQLKKIYDSSRRAHWWKLLANTGMRASEALNLKWENVTEDSIYILSSEEKRTKSGKYREIPKLRGAAEALAEFEKEDNGDYIFPRIWRTSLSRAARQDIKGAGFIGSAHTFRHTFCSLLLQNGMDLKSIQALAGHSTIKVTEKYLHVDKNHLTKYAGLNF